MHSPTSTSEFVGGPARKLEQELTRMVEKVSAEEFTPARFPSLPGDMGALLAGIGRGAGTQIVEDRDDPRTSVEIDGRRLRYRDGHRRDGGAQLGNADGERDRAAIGQDASPRTNRPPRSKMQCVGLALRSKIDARQSRMP